MTQTVRAARCQRSFILWAATGVLGALGCGGGAERMYRPSVEIDAGAGASETGDLPADAGGGDLPPPVDGPQPPVTGPGAHRILSGAVAFLANGLPCTNEASSTEDMWCAILRPSTVLQGSVALYVVNVTQAMAGAPIACGSPLGDPNCLMLTSGFVENDTHRAAFSGRTLVYYDQTATPYGWRPGMLNGRRLVVVTSETGDAHDCTGAVKSDLVSCLQDVTPSVLPGLGGGGSSTAQHSNLLVGHVGNGSPVLPVVDTVISNDTNDSAQRFQFRFVGSSGDRFAWSSREETGGPEILKTQIVGADDSRKVVATDVSRWNLSPDGTRWAWLSEFNYSPTVPAGILQTAPFPEGAAPVTLLKDTATFSFLGNGGMAALDKDGQLFGVPAARVAGGTDEMTALDTQVLGVIATSSAGHLAYVKMFDFVFGLVDLFMATLDGTTTCNLNRRQEVPFGSSLGPRFLPNGAALLWARVTNLDTTDDRLIAAGKFTRTSDCTTQNVSPDLVSLGPLGDEGITVSDSYDGTSGSLYIRTLTSGGDMLAPGEPTLVQTKMNSSLSLYPYLRALIYTVNVGDPADGLYIRPSDLPR